MGYVFFDTETSGLDTRFDQIIQFAAIRTDEELNERDRLNLRCRLQPHIIPSPVALAVNGVSVDRCFDKALPTHYEMISEVRDRLLEWSPSVFVGWNSIRFDEELLRHAFYQCLHNAFLTNRDGNARLDLLLLANAAATFEPGCLTIPKTETGSETFSLDPLARANAFSPRRAHDALSDVEATLHLARILKKSAPNVWSQAIRFSQKKAATDFLESNEPCIVTEVFGGRCDQYPIVKIGADPEIRSYLFTADLTRDFDNFLILDENARQSWIEEPPKPVRRIKANASPMLLPLDELDDFDGWSVDALYARAQSITENEELCEALSESYAATTAREYESVFVEQQLYGEFIAPETERAIEPFHSLPWEKRASMLSRIPDGRCRKLALRLIHEHAGSTLSKKQREIMAEFPRKRALGITPKSEPAWRTIASARAELTEARGDARYEDNVELFEDYEDYLAQLERRYA